MPKMTIQHESWCADHNDDDNACCSQIAAYGPTRSGFRGAGSEFSRASSRTSALWSLPQIMASGRSSAID